LLLLKTSSGKDPKAGLKDPKGAPGAEVGPLLPALERAAAHRADAEQAVRHLVERFDIEPYSDFAAK
jgi:hypothetical protein